MRLKDLTGQRFGKLTVIKRTENMGKQTAWLCKCDCGNEKAIPSWNLVSGQTVSCGCNKYNKAIMKENATIHGQSYTRLYTIWIGVKQRCLYKKHRFFSRYGGRGITVCDEWKNDFQAFYDWAMSHGYDDDLTIDRIDVNGNYEPSNCRWVTAKQQQNNKRTNRFIEFNGVSHTIAEWSDITGIPHSTICNRIKYGWTIEKTLTVKEAK